VENISLVGKERKIHPFLIMEKIFTDPFY
jgi:hypothetical protein